MKPRSQRDERRRLEEVLPLEQPFYIFIDPTNICNLKCVFCQVSHFRETGKFPNSTHLDFDLYEKTIDGLGEFGKPLELVKLYNHGEPLLNPRFADMVRYAKASGYVKRVETVTNGVLLQPELVDEIIAAGIDKIHISLNGLSDEQLFQVTQRKISFMDYFRNLQYLYECRKSCQVVIKVVEDLFPNRQKLRQFCRVFSSVADSLEIESCHDWPEQRMDNAAPGKLDALRKASEVAFDLEPLEKELPEISEKPFYYRNLDDPDDKLVCPNIFYSLVVNATGTVSICCADNANRLLCGNVSDQSISEIWRSEELFHYQEMHLLGRRNEIPFCRDCMSVKYFSIDNLDSHRETILQRFKMQRQRL